ncbi:metal ABC transporter permease [Isoptericola croceus]|uniref:metal ABC transporter permease n=1 Tax=Isoptericola croceus TaxID=3031406 RepID=UPI0023F935F1|nr:metal ABC transporter permease [Isoptericola croceus]
MTVLDLFTDHTYRTVIAGTSLVGLVAGAWGVFAYLRKQSLISDVVAHAALPGTLVAFLVAVGLGLDGRAMPALVVGAVVSGVLAVAATHAIIRCSRVRADAAMAVVLTTFFGAGMLLLRHITDGPYPGKGGIQGYLFGDASTLTLADLRAILVVCGAALLVLVLCFKEISHRAFDAEHSAIGGRDGRLVDAVTFATIAVATVIGIKAVGLVLMVAFVITPPAAARQWTRSVRSMTVLSATFGAMSSGIGAALSIVWALPTGPVVVLVLFVILVVSLVAAPRRSIVVRALARRRARRALRESLVAA